MVAAQSPDRTRAVARGSEDAAAFRTLERALSAAVNASIPYPQADRPKFIASHLRGRIEFPPQSPLHSSDQSALKAELTALAKLLASVINATRSKPGWPIEAVAAALAALDEPAEIASFNSTGSLGSAVGSTTHVVGSERFAAREAATAAALAICEQAASRGLPPSAEAATVVMLKRGFEVGWGDHELDLVVRALQRPSFDPQLVALLATRQRLVDAGVVDLCRSLDTELGRLGVTVDRFGLWRQADDAPGGARLGAMGSVLFVERPEDVSTLSLGTQEIRGASLGALLAALPRLTHLSLSTCGFLYSLPDELAGLAPALSELHLAGCTRLGALPETLCSLSALRTLDCSGCEGLRTLPSALGKLGALERLAISQCERGPAEEGAAASRSDEGGPNRRRAMRASFEGPGITTLPSSLCQLPALRHLTIGLPGLDALPDGLGRLATLRTLSLSGCSGLRALPASLSALHALSYLELPSSPATAQLRDGLTDGMRQLATLDLYGCTGLVELPGSYAGAVEEPHDVPARRYPAHYGCVPVYCLTRPTQGPPTRLARTPTVRAPFARVVDRVVASCADCLQSLYVGSLELSALPDAIGTLTSLVHLELRLPALAALPDAIGSLCALTSLCVSHASITTLPDSVGQLGALRVLRLSRCAALASLPSSLCTLTALAYIELHECISLRSLPADFGKLPALMAFDFLGCEDLADVLYDDPVVDALEAAGCGLFGPGIEIETPNYVRAKREFAEAEAERKERLATLRAV